MTQGRANDDLYYGSFWSWDRNIADVLNKVTPWDFLSEIVSTVDMFTDQPVNASTPEVGGIAVPLQGQG